MTADRDALREALRRGKLPWEQGITDPEAAGRIVAERALDAARAALLPEPSPEPGLDEERGDSR